MTLEASGSQTTVTRVEVNGTQIITFRGSEAIDPKTGNGVEVKPGDNPKGLVVTEKVHTIKLK